MTPEEAGLAKLFTNVLRYIKFATANQLYMMAYDRGLDFERIRRGLILDYPRAADMPAAGFAAGPHLFKDTLQRASLSNKLKHILEFKAEAVLCTDPYVPADPRLRPFGKVLAA